MLENLNNSINVLTRFSSSFQKLIKDLAESKTRTQTDQIISKEITYLKKKIVEPNLTSKQQREHLIRLVYCSMLGYDVTFANMEVVKFTQQKNLTEKQVAYISLSLLLDKSMEQACMMSIGSIQRDLESSNLLEVCFGLFGTCEIIPNHLLDAVRKQVVDSLHHQSELVRKRGVMTALRLLDTLPAQTFTDLLYEDTDPAVIGALLNVLALLIRNNREAYLFTLPKFVELLKHIRANKLHDAFTFKCVPAPWIQIKLLKVFALLANNDKSATFKIEGVLKDCLENTNTKYSIGCAVVYECMRTVACVYERQPLIERATDTAARMLISGNANLKYLGIKVLTQFANISEKYVTAKHQKHIVQCLLDSDETLKRKALDLLYRLTNEGNVKNVCKQFMNELRQTNDEKHALVTKIAHLAQRFFPDNEWFVDIMLELYDLAGDLVNEDITCKIITRIAKGTTEDEDDRDELDKDLRRYAVMRSIEVLERQQQQCDSLLQLVAWCVGEYFGMIEGYDVEHVVHLLYQQLEYNFKDENTEVWIISSISKLVYYSPTFALLVKPIAQTKLRMMDGKQRYRELTKIVNTFDTVDHILPFGAIGESTETDLSHLLDFVDQALQNGAKEYTKFLREARKEEPSEFSKIRYEHHQPKVIPQSPQEHPHERTSNNNLQTIPHQQVMQQMLPPQPPPAQKPATLWSPTGYKHKQIASPPTLTQTPSETSSQSPSTSVLSERNKPGSPASRDEPLSSADRATEGLMKDLFQPSADVKVKRSRKTKQKQTHLLDLDDLGCKSEEHLGSLKSENSAKSLISTLETDDNPRQWQNILAIEQSSPVKQFKVDNHLITKDSLSLIQSLELSPDSSGSSKPSINESLVDTLVGASTNEIPKPKDNLCEIPKSTVDLSELKPTVNLCESSKPTDDFCELVFTSPVTRQSSSHVTNDLLMSSLSSDVLPVSNNLHETPQLPVEQHIPPQPAAKKKGLPEEYSSFSKATPVYELTSDVNIRLQCQHLYTKDRLAFALYILNKSCNSLANVCLDLIPPSNLSKSREARKFSWDEILPREQTCSVLEAEYTSPSLNMLMSGDLTYSGAVKKLFVKHPVSPSALMRKCDDVSEVEFNEAWKSKSLFEKRSTVTINIDGQHFDGLLQSFNMTSVLVTEGFIHACGRILDGSVIYARFQLSTNALILKSPSVALNVMILNLFSKL